VSPRVWLAETIGAIVFLSIAAVLVNMSIDIYGIFRGAKGRHLAIYGDERIARYLLSEKYVPQNFDALLIGSSVSANWNTSGIEGLRVYNESVNGGNIVEEKAIADQALASSSTKVVLLIINPYLTASHDFETVQLTARENLAALGSQSLFEAYKSEARIQLHVERQPFDESGTGDFGDAPQTLNPTLQKLMAPGTEFSIDHTAMTSYKALVDELHSSGIPIVYVIPPVSQRILDLKPGAFATYSQLVLATRTGQDKVIDFTSDEFSGFRGNPENFRDGIHLKSKPAREVVAAINRQVNEWIRNGELPNLHGANVSR
jgi:hypothetical protein